MPSAKGLCAQNCTRITVATALTLHLLQLAHVGAEQRVDALCLTVSIDVQLNVCWEATNNTERVKNKNGYLVVLVITALFKAQ